ncbi:hypothetical protein KY360_07280 [Candidatus Woesearchaeota archaeon]|nr:hypothetical protein [Candidatus Woesearchaeota archaeon]
MTKIKLKKSHIGFFLLLLIFLFSIHLFGLTGLRTVLGFFIVLILPTYLIMKNINIEDDERIFFSFFLGLIYFPLVTWYTNRIVPSLRISIIVTLVLLIIIGIYLKFKKKHKV